MKNVYLLAICISLFLLACSGDPTPLDTRTNNDSEGNGDTSANSDLEDDADSDDEDDGDDDADSDDKDDGEDDDESDEESDEKDDDESDEESDAKDNDESDEESDAEDDDESKDESDAENDDDESDAESDAEDDDESEDATDAESDGDTEDDDTGSDDDSEDDSDTDPDDTDDDTAIGSDEDTESNEDTESDTPTGSSIDYKLPPPSKCHNEDFLDVSENGCIDGDATSPCGGKCKTSNACSENHPNSDPVFMCPRSMLLSPEMKQAAIDDGNSMFNYAVVGHDVDTGGIDGNVQSTCCQCYQLVYAWPSVANERQCQLNPDNPEPPASGIPIPKPLIVQSFNTAATPHSFDVYMAAGGLGAHNACSGEISQTPLGLYMYTRYPPHGQTSNGGVKAVTWHEFEPYCKNQYMWVTTETLGSDECQSVIAEACDMIESDIPGLTEQSRESCKVTNSTENPYHLNWSVYAMKVECPEQLTRVTGCKLQSQGLPEVDQNVTDIDQAKADDRFWSSSSTGEPYMTTTMEDCCRPSCASIDWITGRGLTSDPDYNAFYSCDVNGQPYTE